jgi:hypothetical protein
VGSNPAQSIKYVGSNTAILYLLYETSIVNAIILDIKQEEVRGPEK